jgi:zinc transport system substrate-binding protein
MKTSLILISLSLIGLSLAACAGSGGDDGRTTVAAAFYPLAEAARQVGGSDVHVSDLTPPGAEPHDLELTPKTVSTIEDADLVLLMGHRFQPAVEGAAKRNDHRLAILDALHVTGDDPHVWLDPVRMRAVVDLVEHALADADPHHANVFAARAERYEAKLKALDTDMRTGLSHCQRTDIVTSHQAFGWLAKRYGLTQDAIVGITPDAEPSSRRLDELVKLVKEKSVTTIFTETLVSPKVADVLAREAGVTTAVLNPLEGLSTRQIHDGETYISVMRDNLTTLRVALNCG